MLRRVFNSLLETSVQAQNDAVAYPNPFTKLETIPFGWLSSVAPCFPVRSTHIRVLSDPREFYNAVKEGCANAEERIFLASLYWGLGELEKGLVTTLLSNESFRSGHLSLNVLIDYMRGSRFEDNSRTVLKPLLKEGHKCKISLYHTPILRGVMRRITPDRWNELCGLQHMKLYIFDDTLVISGANLSNDYFTNRQDRYFVIQDKRLCDFYCGLVGNVQKFSLRMDAENNVGLCDEDWRLLPYEGDKNEFIEKAGDLIENYIVDAISERNTHKEEGFDTWVFPLTQMGQLGINQDSDATDRILSEAPRGSSLNIATSYFNLTSQYMSTLITRTRAKCNILMAHPKTNGFLGARGPAGGIPFAYSLIARKFQLEFEKYKQENRISLFEYLRDDWTYHGKGLWYYPHGSDFPCLTLIGSPNFGERSVKRDLETQLAIVTENPELRKKLHDECQRLYKFGRDAETNRSVPKWVYAFVFFFRNYF